MSWTARRWGRADRQTEILARAPPPVNQAVLLCGYSGQYSSFNHIQKGQARSDLVVRVDPGWYQVGR